MLAKLNKHCRGAGFPFKHFLLDVIHNFASELLDQFYEFGTKLVVFD